MLRTRTHYRTRAGLRLPALRALGEQDAPASATETARQPEDPSADENDLIAEMLDQALEEL
jgi:hypothetical protein